MDTPDSAKQIVRVTIFNQTFAVSTSGDPRDAEQLAHEIDELMLAIARRVGNLDTTRTALLACFHLADRLRATEKELDSLKECITHKTRDFASLLDRAFAISEVDVNKS